MNQKVLQTLEFDKIINILTGYATTELGKLMCANLKPMTEEADILNAQDQTQDALTRIYKRGNVSFFGVSAWKTILKQILSTSFLKALFL